MQRLAHDQHRDQPQTAQARPKVSACLLTYNHRHLIESTIQSVLEQTYPDFELIVSDDRSTDGTFEALQALAKNNPKLRIIQPPKNLGMAANANFAVSHARGEYIALLHHDDIYSPRLIEAWATVLDRNPSAGFASNSYVDFKTGRMFLHPFAECNQGERILREAMLPNWGCPVRGTAMVRRSAWDAVGGMREQFGMLADVDLWMRLAAQYDLGYVREPLISVRNDRPEYYPDAYWRWSWPRYKLTYILYGANHESFYGRSTLKGRAHLAVYRARVNVDIVRWLGYGIVKRRGDILASSDQVGNMYEYLPVVALRKLLKQLSGVFPEKRA